MRTTPLNRIETAVLIGGAASMSLEIVAGRIITPHFGSSIHTWGTIIGVFLTALSLGYYTGAQYATHASPERLMQYLLGGAVLTAYTTIAATPLTQTTPLALPSPYAALPTAILLFSPPAFLLGLISPTGAQLSRWQTKGQAAGRTYTLGTVGSIIGTFGTTFYLIPAFTTTQILIGITTALLITACVVATRTTTSSLLQIMTAVTLILIAFTTTSIGTSVVGDTVLYTTQTPYQQLQVVQDDNTRSLVMNGGRQGAMNLSNTTMHVFDYTRYFHMPFLLNQDIDNVLFIGAGTYTGPKAFLKRYNITADVVEIDPIVVDVAEQYFKVPTDPTLSTTVMDGRQFLKQTNTTYDLIIMDAFTGTDIPFHMTTLQYAHLMRERLSQNGTVVTNVIAPQSGTGSTLYKALYKTYSTAFPTVYAFGTEQPQYTQNIELVATKQTKQLNKAALQQRNRNKAIGINLSREITTLLQPPDTHDIDLLTDEHAPVDTMAAN